MSVVVWDDALSADWTDGRGAIVNERKRVVF